MMVAMTAKARPRMLAPSETGAVCPETAAAGWELGQRFRRLIDALDDARLACARVAVGPVRSYARNTR
jgi:hypothetical protein